MKPAMLIVCLLTITPRVSWASSDDEARNAFNDGVVAFEAGRVDEALRSFERAYALLAIVIFLSIGGHHAWLEAIAASYTTFPIAHMSQPETATALAIARAVASAIGLAVLLALPGVATALLVEVVTALAKRSASRLTPLLTSIPARTLAVVGVTTLGLGVFGEAFASAARDAMTALGGF